MSRIRAAVTDSLLAAAREGALNYKAPSPDYTKAPETIKSEGGLTAAEKKEQAARCGCRGTDSDYCGCQNVPDRETMAARERGASADG